MRGTESGKKCLGSLALLAVADVNDALAHAETIVCKACRETVLGKGQEHAREVLWWRICHRCELEKDSRQTTSFHRLEK